MSEEYYEEDTYEEDEAYYEDAHEEGYNDEAYYEESYNDEAYYEGYEDGQIDFLENEEIDLDDLDQDYLQDADSELANTAGRHDKDGHDDKSDLISLAALAALAGTAAAKSNKGRNALANKKKRNDFVKPKDPRELAHLGLARNRTFKNARDNNAARARRNQPRQGNRQNETAYYERIGTIFFVILFIVWAFVGC